MNENVQTRPYVYIVEHYDSCSDEPLSICGVFDVMEKAQEYFESVKLKGPIGRYSSLCIRKVPLNVGVAVENNLGYLYVPEIGNFVVYEKGGNS